MTIAAQPCYKRHVPKLVDHEERRREIARATWQVITRDGVDAASVRSVAAESGLSTGALRHYFADQGSLLLFAAQQTLERIVPRMGAQLARRDRPDVEVVQACLEELLPLDEERHTETAVYFGLIDLTRLDPGHRDFRLWVFETSRAVYRCLVSWLAGGPAPTDSLLRTGEPQWLVPLADPVLEAQALSLQVLMDGLAVQGLLYPQVMDGPTLRSVLRGELDRIVGGSAGSAGSGAGGSA